MSLKKKFVLNTGIVSITKIVENIISYLIIVLLSHTLGAHGLGQYSFIFSFVGLFFILTDWGLSSMMIKDLSKDFSLAKKYIPNVFAFKLISTSLSALIYIIVIFFMQKEGLFWSLIWAGGILFVNTFFYIYYNVLQIKTEGLRIGIAAITERLIAVIGGFFVLYFFQDITLFIFILFIANLIRFALVYFFTRKYIKIKFKVDYVFLKSLVAKGFPFVLISTFSIVFVRMDTVMLSLLKTYEVVGWYSAGYKLIDVLGVFPALLLTFGFPMLSKFIKENKNIAKTLFEQILYYSLIGVMPICVGVLFIGGRILDFIYGFSSIESEIAFKILIVALIFIYLTTILGYLITAADKQTVFAKIGGLGAGINIILNFLLIPKYSLYGAGIATLITYIVMFIVMTIYINKNIFRFHFRVLLPLFAVSIMAIAVYFSLSLHIIWIVIIAGIVYTSIVGSWMLIKKEIPI